MLQGALLRPPANENRTFGPHGRRGGPLFLLAGSAGADARRIGTLHAGYLRDGTFALLDSLDAGMVSHLERMQAACTRREVPRLVVCLTLHFRLSRRLTDVEIPFVYRRFPPPWEYLEPDAATRLGTDR